MIMWMEYYFLWESGQLNETYWQCIMLSIVLYALWLVQIYSESLENRKFVALLKPKSVKCSLPTRNIESTRKNGFESVRKNGVSAKDRSLVLCLSSLLKSLSISFLMISVLRGCVQPFYLTPTNVTHFKIFPGAGGLDSPSAGERCSPTKENFSCGGHSYAGNLVLITRPETFLSSIYSRQLPLPGTKISFQA